MCLNNKKIFENNKVLEIIDNHIRKHNPYYHAYKQLHQVESEQKEKLKVEGVTQMPSIHMAFKRHFNDDPRRYNVPKIGEIAAVFSGEDSLEASERDFQIFPRMDNANNLTKLNVLSHHIDPMTYPLLHLHGEPGWRPGIQHQPKFR